MSETSPSWDAMSDLDRGAALLHIWKVQREGLTYALENYPCEYIDDEGLRALAREAACQHAQQVCGSYDAIRDRLGDNEFERLYNLALTQGQEILDSCKLWAARHENGTISVCDTEEFARFLVTNPGWRCTELLHRTEPGGDWSIVLDAQGMEQDCPWRWVRIGDDVLIDGTWTRVLDRQPSPEDVPSRITAEVVDLAGGRRIDLPPEWKMEEDPSRWTVRIRRRAEPAPRPDTKPVAAHTQEPRHMVDLDVAYATLNEVLAGEQVLVSDLRGRRPPTDTVEQLLASSPPAYSVQVTATLDTVNISWNGRFGFLEDHTKHPYPVPHTDPAFRDRLADLIIPIVRDYRRRAQDTKLTDYAQDAPGDVYEARDAIRRAD